VLLVVLVLVLALVAAAVLVLVLVLVLVPVLVLILVPGGFMYRQWGYMVPGEPCHDVATGEPCHDMVLAPYEAHTRTQFRANPEHFGKFQKNPDRHRN
jgi:membrane protein YdbS with pleckstrin-like domain